MNSIVTDLVNLALQNGISVYMEPDLGPETPSFADTDSKSIFINSNNFGRRQLALQIAHEIAHILNGDKSAHFLGFNSIYSDPKIEIQANRTAIQMLIPYYADERSVDFINTNEFMQMFDIPAHLENVVIEEFKKYM